jgi:tryptophan-rich sensory protein
MPKARYSLSAAGAGLIASLFSLRMGEVFAALKLPLFFPPVWLLPVGWTVILILLASGIPGESGKKTVTAFYVSLSLVIVWAVLLFRLNAPVAAALAGLLLTGVWLYLRRLIGETSAQMKNRLLPCCVWAGYLTYLNMGICLMN